MPWSFSSYDNGSKEQRIQFEGNGKLNRYAASIDNPVNQCELQIAQYTGAKYALAVNSGTSAIFLALYALGVQHGDEVIVSGFTFVSVPSAIIQLGAKPVLVDITDDYTLDFEDLKRKISPATKAVLVTHMRSLICDLRELKRICDEHGIPLVEDCAHSLGATFDGIYTGRFGIAGCFSTQSKMLNSGEGGLIITDSLELMTKAILLSGCYEKNYRLHAIDQELFERYQSRVPCFGMRLSCLNASCMLLDIADLPRKAEEYRTRLDKLYSLLTNVSHIVLPQIDKRAVPCSNCVIMRLKNMTKEQKDYVKNALQEKHWAFLGYSEDGNCRNYNNWRFIPERQVLMNAEKLFPDTFELALPANLDLSGVEELVSTLDKTIKAAI